MKDIEPILAKHYAAARAQLRSPLLAYGISISGRRLLSIDDTLPFRIASMTKSFTAAAVLLLRDRGMLRLDEPITSYLPELRLEPATSDCPALTVRHLLTMSSGLATDDPWADRLLDANQATMDSLFAEGVLFATAPNTAFTYSNFGYAMLGRAISNVAGEPFQTFISDQLLGPLEMHATTWDAPAQRADPMRVTDGVAVPEGQELLADGGFAAMGGLWSTVDDLLTWTDYFIDAFPARDDPEHGPLRRSTRREMQQLATVDADAEVRAASGTRQLFGGYGMGLLTYDDERMGRLVSHSGGLPGYGSNMIWWPERQVAFVALANITYAELFTTNIDAFEHLLDAGLLPSPSSIIVPTTARPPLAEVADRLIDVINSWDVAAVATLFSENVGPDLDFGRRRNEVHAVTGGRTIRQVDLVVRNASEADAIAEDEAGARFEISFSLAPTLPLRVQAFTVAAIDQPSHA